MADTKVGRGGVLGPFRLGRRYKEVGLDLGRFHEARHAWTGRASWVLQPGTGVEWQFGGPWEVRLCFRPEPAAMTLEVVRAPVEARMVELADMLVTMTAAVERVEATPPGQTHLARRRRALPRVVGLASLAVLGAGLGLWLSFAEEPESAQALENATGSPSQVDAPETLHTAGAEGLPIAYPLPYEPFRNQAKAPCRADLAELEINAGCWVELAQKPPCAKNRAEHQGKCYLPVSKDRGAPPQSARP